MKHAMKLLAVVSALGLGGPLVAPAALYTTTFNSGFANGGLVPDADIAGWQDTRTLSGVAG